MSQIPVFVSYTAIANKCMLYYPNNYHALHRITTISMIHRIKHPLHGTCQAGTTSCSKSSISYIYHTRENWSQKSTLDVLFIKCISIDDMCGAKDCLEISGEVKKGVKGFKVERLHIVTPKLAFGLSQT